MKVVGCRFSSARVVVLTRATVPPAWTAAANDAEIAFPVAADVRTRTAQN